MNGIGCSCKAVGSTVDYGITAHVVGVSKRQRNGADSGITGHSIKHPLAWIDVVHLDIVDIERTAHRSVGSDADVFAIASITV